MFNELRVCFVLAVLLFLSLSNTNAVAADANEISLTVTEPSGVQRTLWPVTSGVPLAQGELRSDRRTALYDAEGQEVPLQTEVLSRWPDGSVRWLLLDFQVDLATDESQQLALRYGPQVRRSTEAQPPLVISAGSHTHRITPVLDPGPIRIILSADRFRLLDAIWFDDNGDGQFADSERVTGDQSTGIVLVGSDGTRYRADLSLATWTIEQHGPLRACVRIDGRHRAEDGSTMFRYIVRLHVFRGQPFFKFDYTFVNDHQDSLMATFDSIELVCSTNDSSDQSIVNSQTTTESSRLFQFDDQQFEVDGKTSSGRAPGWAAIGTPTVGMAMGVREFWQNWPKSLEVKPGELRIGLCPEFPKGQYDGRPLLEEAKHYYYLRDGVYTLKIGAARTHQMWATLFSGEPKSDQLASFFRATEQPLLAQCSPEYVCSTGVLGNSPPADPTRYHGYDGWLDVMFQKHLDDQENLRENGMLNFGDWYDEKKFGGGWGNQEYDTSHNFFVQYLRTGDRRYFDRARQGAEHLMDVDVLHAINPHIRGLDHHGQPQPGQVWKHVVGHTGGYYEGADLKAPIWDQRGVLHDWGHVWIGGLAHCYQLTGDRRALDVARLVADRVASECPTPYSNHIRDVGWPLNLVMTAYELTGDEKYLAAAGRQWETLKENMDPEQGWMIMLAYGHCSMKSEADRCHGQVSYLMALTLSALSRYHQATGDPEVLEGITIGLDQIIRTCWSEEHKSFYATPCVHVRQRPPGAFCPTTLLSSLAFAHEISLTGNKEHQRIFREAFQTSMAAGKRLLETDNPQVQAGYFSRAFHFTPFGLRILKD